MIQDYIFTAGTIIFILALFPSILGKDKPAITTSLLTATTLFVFALTYISLELWFTSALTFVTSALWYTLAAQEFIKKRK